MTTSRPHDRLHIILVEPAKSLNIGAAARAMANLGFSHLHLVAPVDFDRETAEVTALHAKPLLDRMTVHTTFEEAIAPMEMVVGFSERAGPNPAHYQTLPEWAATLPATPVPKTALVFGPEVNGLRPEHFNQCQRVLRIPTSTEFPSFNLAQSVLLALYEITRVLADAEPNSNPSPVPDLPDGNQFHQLDRLLDTVMEESGFIRSGSPTPAPGMVKAHFRRQNMTQQEMGLLLALFRRIEIALKRKGPG